MARRCLVVGCCIASGSKLSVRNKKRCFSYLSSSVHEFILHYLKAWLSFLVEAFVAMVFC